MTKHVIYENELIHFPGKTSEYTIGKINSVYCSCPSFQFMKENINSRVCKHIKEYIDPICYSPEQQRKINYCPKCRGNKVCDE